MSGVLDAFFVEIGLDPTKYKKGAQETVDADKRVREHLLKSGNEIEVQGKRTGESILGLRNNVLSLFAAFTGVGAAAFVRQMVNADAATGRSAKTLNMSTSALGAWETAAELAGAKAGELTGGFNSLTQALETATLTGDASLGAKFRQLFDIDIMDEATGKLKTASQLYLELAGKMQGMDPAKAATAANILGVPAGVIPLLLQGRTEIEKTLAAVQKLGPATDEDAAAAVRLQNAWTNAFKAIQGAARSFYPIATAVGNSMRRVFTEPTAEEKEKIKNQTFSERASDAWKGIKSLFSPTGEDEKSSLSQVGSGASQRSLPSSGAFNSQQEKEAFIRTEAARRGIDPNVAMAVAKSEGFYNYKGDTDATGKATSFGAFQLHYPGIGRHTADGLGTKFTKKTGLDARDPATEREQIKFALDEAAKGGWTPWHGWRGAPNAGLIGAAPALPSGGPSIGAGSSSRSSQSTTTTDVHIGSINVYPPNGDPETIAKSLGPAIKRDLFTQQANDGPQ